MPAPNVDAYIADCPPAARARLAEVRALVHATVPGLTERISYGIPTFDLNGRYVVYIAGWPKHIGLYPITGATAETFADELAGYKRGKGSVQFPLDAPLPVDLIRRIVAYRAAEVAEGRR